jgi:hypothetical protein
MPATGFLCRYLFSTLFSPAARADAAAATDFASFAIAAAISLACFRASFHFITPSRAIVTPLTPRCRHITPMRCRHYCSDVFERAADAQ